MRKLLQTSLRWKLTVFVAAAVVLTAAALSAVGYRFTIAILRAQIYERLSVVQGDRQKMLLDYVQHQQQLVLQVASRTRLRDLVAEHNDGKLNDKPFRQETERILRDALRSCESFESLWVANRTGVVVTATAENFLWKDLSVQPEFQAGRTNSHMGVISLAEGKHEVVAVAPMRSEDGQLLGVVMALLDADGVVKAVANVTGLGETGEVLVGRRVGDRIRYVVPARFHDEVTDVPAASMPAMVEAIKGNQGFVRTRDHQGADVLAAYGPVGYLDWGLVAKMNWDEAYQPIVWLRRILTAVLAVMLAAGVLASYELSRRFTKPILELASMTEAIATGAMNTRLPVRTRDEIGKLCFAFNHMAEKLADTYAALEERVRQRTAALAAERHLLQSLMDHVPDHIYFKDKASRFLRVNRAMARWIGTGTPEHTIGKSDADVFSSEHAEAAQADEQQVMETGRPIVGKEEKETWPDGRETWVSTTKAPFRDEDGNLVGTFGISRDITRRTLAEQKLALYARVLEDKNRQIEEDLIMAREVQLALLPQSYPTFPSGTLPEHSALRFCHHYQPTSTLGGDFFEVVVPSETQAGIFIGDVMGHGVRAALIMAVIRGLVDEMQAFAGDPNRFLKEINRALVVHQVSNAPVFATALYMVVDAANGDVHCASAGHPSPFWMRRDLGRVEPLVTGTPRNGPVLGLLADADYPAAQHTLAVNDAVLLYTDGLCEVRNADDDSYGAARVQAFLQERLTQPCDHLLQALVTDARRHAARGEFEDDVCLVSVQLAKYLL